LDNTLLNDQWIIKEIGEELENFLEANENENKTCQSLWNINTFLRETFTAISAYIKKTELPKMQGKRNPHTLLVRM
jgi:hypothetical protein